jgi:single-stranded-DNA-specific exonuclease
MTKSAELASANVAERLPAAAGPEARELARTNRVSITLAEILWRRGITETAAIERFLEPKLAHLTPPDRMVDRDPASERIAHAIQHGESICVFGDYDCDGITSAAIVTGVIEAMGGNARPLLASRFDGGYGVSAAAVSRIVQSGAKLLVTCDCGSSDHASLAEVRRHGIDVVVIDHHLVPSEPLPAIAFLNPHRPECGFPYKGLASCGLALSLAAAVRAKLGKQIDLREWLDLVAIGTIADVAPLDGDNRALVKAGLRVLQLGRRPGVRALLELARFDALRQISGEDVAYRIAPRINAPGRLGSPDLALELLLSKTEDDARAIGARIEQLSNERRSIQERMVAEAVAEIEADGWAERSAIVVGKEGWNHGIVGIVAGRLATRYERPVIVVGFEGAVGRGSVRGPKGSRLHTALGRVESALERYGGHQAAAGVEVKLEKLGELREGFERACEELAQSSGPSHDKPNDFVLLDPSDAPHRVLGDLNRLEPCGQANEKPRLVIDCSVVAAREVKGGHLKLELALANNVRVAGFGVNMGSRAGELTGDVCLLGTLRHDAWRGGNAVEVRVERIID